MTTLTIPDMALFAGKKKFLGEQLRAVWNRVGGTDRLVTWAMANDGNYEAYLKLMAKMEPREVEVTDNSVESLIAAMDRAAGVIPGQATEVFPTPFPTEYTVVETSAQRRGLWSAAVVDAAR